ncbi:glycoside hydrolase family 3 N-terminal domain-containing protein [Zafaria sp. Z1313]|uniref:glycoside hydrolase family 3 N-terminal domain-containing protein n=1 Tax=Zafaria sp. Z1313 TaxID=3423202 RepID=UPI003D3017D7
MNRPSTPAMLRADTPPRSGRPPARRTPPAILRLTAAVAAVALLASCTPAVPEPDGSSPAPASSSTAPPEPARTSWGPLEDDVEAAGNAVAAMSLEEKAGQVLVGFYSGVDPAAELERAAELHLGGVIIMGDNVPLSAGGAAGGGAAGEGAEGGASGVDTDELAETIAAFQDVLTTGRDWPGIVGVDQEGGLVARLKAPLVEWPTPMAFGAAGDPALTGRAQAAMDAELAALGFTMNFSPDADVTIGPADPVIGARSFSSDADTVAEHAVAAVEGALSAGVLPAVKHFPGHGSVTTDSHVGLPVQDATAEELAARDWVPFARAAEAGAPMVMMGHIAVADLDPGVPSSLSAANYEALRGLGFEGVVVTDALNMGAVEQSAPGGTAAVGALAAGADLLLMPSDSRRAHAAVVDAIEAGELDEARLDEAAVRVVALMMWQERLAGDAGAEGSAAGDSSGASSAAPASRTAHAVALEAARAAVTQVEGECGAPLVGEAIQIVGGRAEDRDRLAAAAREAGLRLGAGDVVTLLGAGSSTGNGDVVVALDAPWGLARSTGRTAEIALFGRSPESFTALVEVLTGGAAAPGTLPVAVGDHPLGHSTCP